MVVVMVMVVVVVMVVVARLARPMVVVVVMLVVVMLVVVVVLVVERGRLANTLPPVPCLSSQRNGCQTLGRWDQPNPKRPWTCP